MLNILKTALSWLECGDPMALATICQQTGSTPRTSGATMAVRHDGIIVGTVGGGIVEAQVIKSCQDMLAGDEHACLKSFDLDAAGAAQAGMICGGRLQIFLHRFDATSANISFFKKAIQSLQSGRAVAALCELDGPGQRCFLLVDGEPADILDELPAQPQPELLQNAREALAMLNIPHLLNIHGRRVLIFPFAPPSTAIIAGAGHVGLHTAVILNMVGFRTVVIDDREEFANRRRFPGVAEIHVPKSFEGCLEAVGVTADSYVVILTRGHLHDKTVLAQALKTPAAYIGMIGSRRKRDATYAALRAEGVEQAALDRVHCPIGLDIDAETPEEIAVSIVAEMIKARADKRKP